MDGNEAMASDITNQTEEENELLADMYYRCKKCRFRVDPPPSWGWCLMFKKIQVVCMKFLDRKE